MQFYIQPDMAELYSKQGYTIIKLEEVVLNDTQISEISTQEAGMMIDKEPTEKEIEFKDKKALKEFLEKSGVEVKDVEKRQKRMAKINDLPLLSNPTEDMYCLVGKDNLKKVPWSAIMGQIGAPYIATTVSGMIDKTRVYVYQGSESGYTSGNWYYWNGSAWTSGGIYNSAAVDTDKTLTQSDKPADSAVVGQQIGELKEDLENVVKITETKSTNKLNFTNVEEQEKNGITMSYQDNVLSLNGTASAKTEFTIPLAENLSDGIYKFYYELLEGDFNQTILYGYQSNSYAQFTKSTTTVKDTYVNAQNRSKISLTKDQKFENCKFHIWAELSSEATGIFSIPGTTHKDIAFNNDLEIPQVKKNESEINNLQKILATEQNYELITGKMVYKNGEIKSDTNSACINLRLEAGDTIIFKASGSVNHAIISESTPDFGKIINVIKVGTSNDEMIYEYTADQDIYLVLSCRSNKEYSIEKILYLEKLKSALLGILNTKEDYRYLLKVFEGKKGLCIGDSLTYGVVNGASSGAINTTKNYPYWFNKMTNLAVDVDGHPGWTASQMYERVKSNNYAEYGFILLFLGTNGGLTTDEQISAYKQIIEKFISDNNNVKIFLITPFAVNGYSKQDTVDKIYDIGKEKEIAVVNADIAPFKYTVVDGKIHEYDITHLSEMGYFLLANVIANGMGKGIYDYLERYNEC